jgi:hypothetical protein
VRISAPLECGELSVVLEYDASADVIEEDEPVAVSECIPGGDLPSQLTYPDEPDGSSETCLRKLETEVREQQCEPLVAELVSSGAVLDDLFRIDVDGTASSATLSGFTYETLPGHVSVLYRQRFDVFRTAHIVDRENGTRYGKLTLSDCTWGLLLARATSCDPFPTP